MYDKKKCKSCRWHGYFGAKDQGGNNICCDYGILARQGTCLRKIGQNGETIDRRGNDPDNCLLYEKGERHFNKGEF